MCHTQICPRFECLDEHTIHTCVYCVLALNAGTGRGVYDSHVFCLGYTDYEWGQDLSLLQLHYTQGRSQPHSPGWAIVPLSSFFSQILIIFFLFSSNFAYFLPHFGLPGGRVAHPGRPWLRHWLYTSQLGLCPSNSGFQQSDIISEFEVI